MNERYSRQVRFLGAEAQKKIGAARVVLVGCGSLGSAIADQLVRAGVGDLRLCDRDFVEWPNLQSQTLYDEGDVGLPKAVAAARRLARVNSQVRVEHRVVDVAAGNVEALVEGADVALDGTDNFETRFLLNDACVKRGTPWVYGGCVGSYGMAMALRPGAACYACVLPELPAPGSSPTCETAGVLQSAAAVVASIQAAEALKALLGAPPSGLVTIDVWTGRFQAFTVQRRADCRACGRREFPYLEARITGTATALCGRNAVQVSPAVSAELDLAELERRIGGARNEFLLRATVDGLELVVFPDGRAIVKGTDDPAQARTVYAKYVGA